MALAQPVIATVEPWAYAFSMNNPIPQPTLADFVRASDSPILSPDDSLVFDCPMAGKPIHWAKAHTFNPAAIAHEGRVHMFFRAEDGLGKGLGDHTSRVGHAVSDDGVQFSVDPEPVLYPDEDCKEYEWPGGCEDPRICRREDGLFVLYYTMWNRDTARMGAATSTDLVNWTKHGPVFANHERELSLWHKSGGAVQALSDGQLTATKINGKYWIYFGEFILYLATSDDLIHWDPVLDNDGNLLEILGPRDGFFDSALTEVGPPPVVTERGIELIYNGKNHTDAARADTGLATGAYAPATLVLDPADPTTVLHRPDKPFMQPEHDFERSGQYADGTVFTEALVWFKDHWFLYYGTADSYVGVARQ